MRISEILRENVSQTSAIKNITDILTTEIPVLYQKLSNMAIQFEHNNGAISDDNVKKFNFIANGQKSQWYQSVFVSQLKPSLYSLYKFLPNSDAKQQLGKYLDSTISDPKFSLIGADLIPVLSRVSKSINSKQLESGTQAASHAMASFSKLLDKLSYDQPEAASNKPATNKQPSVIGQQNSAVDTIINDVLSKISKQHAGEIRNAISKSDNKLKALQQELQKRSIKI